MKTFFTISAVAAAIFVAPTATLADGHGYSAKDYVVEVPAGLCPDAKHAMARWAYGKSQFSAYAVPTSRTARCGEKGEPVTAGIATSSDRKEARKAALKVCNDNRGDFGRCVIIGTVRLK